MALTRPPKGSHPLQRPLLIVAVVVAVLVIALFVFAGRDTARTPVAVEQAVSLDNLT